MPPDDAIEILSAEVPRAERAQPATSPAAQDEEDRLIFAAMRYILVRHGAGCKRLDVNNFSGEILSTMKSWIRKAIVVVADLSGSNPNVLYEVGFAHALGKPTIHLCSTSLDKLPFDVRTWPTIQYEIGSIYELQPKLVAQLRAVTGSES